MTTNSGMKGKSLMDFKIFINIVLKNCVFNIMLSHSKINVELLTKMKEHLLI